MATATTSNAIKALDMPELVEEILLQLPLIDQFRCTMVSRRFRDIIQIQALQIDMQMTHLGPSALVPPPSEQFTTQFWLGESRALFAKNTIFLDGQASVFALTIARAFCDEEAPASDSQCQLHFSTAPFHIDTIEGPTASHADIIFVFEWEGPEEWLHEDNMILAVNDTRRGQSLLKQPQGSWAQLKISQYALPVTITASVTCRKGCFMFSPHNQINYKSLEDWNEETFELTLSPQQATMGHMVQFLADLREEAFRQEKVWLEGRLEWLRAKYMHSRTEAQITTLAQATSEEHSEGQDGNAHNERTSK